MSNAHQPAYTDQTSGPIYVNDGIENSEMFYDERSTNRGAGTIRVMMRALYDYQAVEDDELSLTAGMTYKIVVLVYDSLLCTDC